MTQVNSKKKPEPIIINVTSTFLADIGNSITLKRDKKANNPNQPLKQVLRTYFPKFKEQQYTCREVFDALKENGYQIGSFENFRTTWFKVGVELKDPDALKQEKLNERRKKERLEKEQQAQQQTQSENTPVDFTENSPVEPTGNPTI